MKLTALVALDLAALLELPMITESPPFAFAFVVINLVLVQAALLYRPLRAFHYTFLTVGVLSTISITALAFSPPARGSLRILETLIHRYRAIQGKKAITSLDLEIPILDTAERWVACAVALLPAWAAAETASRYTRLRTRPAGRLTRDLMTFLKGTLIGFAFFSTAYALTASLDPGLFKIGITGRYALLTTMIAFPLLGGFAVLAWTRIESNRENSRGVPRIDPPSEV